MRREKPLTLAFQAAFPLVFCLLCATGVLEALRFVRFACSQASDGRERWTLELLADQMARLGYVEHISPAGCSLAVPPASSSSSPGVPISPMSGTPIVRKPGRTPVAHCDYHHPRAAGSRVYTFFHFMLPSLLLCHAVRSAFH